jgi:mono/diheme cytochrome c family protein
MLLGTFGAAPVAAQGSNATGDTAVIALGRKLFDGKGLCFSCHGKDGEGVLGPTTRLAGRKLVHTNATASAIAGLIKAGVDSAHSTSGQVMPPKGGSRLSDGEIEAVAVYVIELQQSDVKKPHSE